MKLKFKIICYQVPDNEILALPLSLFPLGVNVSVESNCI